MHHLRISSEDVLQLIYIFTHYVFYIFKCIRQIYLLNLPALLQFVRIRHVVVELLQKIGEYELNIYLRIGILSRIHHGQFVEMLSEIQDILHLYILLDQLHQRIALDLSHIFAVFTVLLLVNKSACGIELLLHQSLKRFEMLRNGFDIRLEGFAYGNIRCLTEVVLKHVDDLIRNRSEHRTSLSSRLCLAFQKDHALLGIQVQIFGLLAHYRLDLVLDSISHSSEELFIRLQKHHAVEAHQVFIQNSLGLFQFFAAEISVYQLIHEMLSEILAALLLILLLYDLLVQLADNLSHGGSELHRIHRLKDIVHHAHLHGKLGILEFAVAAEDYDLHVAVKRSRLTYQLYAVDKRHLYIREKNIHLVFLQEFKSIPAVAGLVDLQFPLLFFQQILDTVSFNSFIIYDQ